MRACTVEYSNGSEITTSINGTDEEIKNYFKVGRYFNLGCVGDDMQQVTKCTVLPDEVI